MEEGQDSLLQQATRRKERDHQMTSQDATAEDPRLPRLGGAITLDNVERVFQDPYWGPGQQDLALQVSDTLIAAAKVILRVVPAGPDRSVALRKLRDCRMDCHSAIRFNGQF